MVALGTALAAILVGVPKTANDIWAETPVSSHVGK
jgi:hypothetical protein